MDTTNKVNDFVLEIIPKLKDYKLKNFYSDFTRLLCEYNDSQIKTLYENFIKTNDDKQNAFSLVNIIITRLNVAWGINISDEFINFLDDNIHVIINHAKDSWVELLSVKSNPFLKFWINSTKKHNPKIYEDIAFSKFKNLLEQGRSTIQLDNLKQLTHDYLENNTKNTINTAFFMSIYKISDELLVSALEGKNVNILKFMDKIPKSYFYDFLQSEHILNKILFDYSKSSPPTKQKFFDKYNSHIDIYIPISKSKINTNNSILPYFKYALEMQNQYKAIYKRIELESILYNISAKELLDNCYNNIKENKDKINDYFNYNIKLGRNINSRNDDGYESKHINRKEALDLHRRIYEALYLEGNLSNNQKAKKLKI